MAGTIKTLYPPLVSTYMPAFLRTAPCRVYFSLSQYNNAADINSNLVQVSISYLDTNISALKTSPKTKVDSDGNVAIDETDLHYYPMGIYFATLKEIQGDVGGSDVTHYIDIPPFILAEQDEGKTAAFGLNQTYKVQLRLTSKNASPFPLNKPKEIVNWVNNNLANFSEWSRVTLIRGISKPILTVKGFNDSAQSASSQTSVITNKMLQSFSGELLFDDSREQEYLKYVRVQIYKSLERESGGEVFNSGEIYPSEYSPNEFYYIVKYVLEEGTQYDIRVTYETINGYSPPEEEILEFTVTTISRSDEDPLKVSVITEMDEENGRVKVSIRPNATTNLFLGNIVIRRASSEDNFKNWEDVHYLVFDGDRPLSTDWYDYTVQSGISYDYGIQKVNEKQMRGIMIQAKNKVMAHFDDMYLNNEKMQLKIKFDPTISSFKTTIYESKIDTIGSQYPYFKQNANVAYRQFPITGVITSWCDEDGIYLNKEKIYGDVKYLYDDYKDKNKINNWQDFFYEKQFRDKVIEFLQANDVKLFRSTTEGNILVKLMDVSFTPNQTIGRMIYSFSATAYEVADYTIDNCDKYNIQKVGQYRYGIVNYEALVGQVMGEYGGAPHLDLINGTTKGGKKGDIKFKTEALSPNGYIYTLRYLSWVRFTFQSNPYPIKLIPDSQTSILKPAPATKEDMLGLHNNLLLGYIVYVNGEAIIVNQKGIYELYDDDTYITSIKFPEEVKAVVKIDYVGRMEEEVDTSNLPDRLTYFYKVGQLHDVYAVGESVIRNIFLKYYNKYDDEYWKIVSVDEIHVETEPGTIIYLKDSFNNSLDKHIVGETGVLTFESSEATFDEMYFGGKALNPAPTSFGPETSLEDLKDIDYNAKENEYIYTGVVVDSLDAVESPIEHGVYICNTPPKRIVAKTLEAKTASNEQISENDLSVLQPLHKIQSFVASNEYCYFRGHWYAFSFDPESKVGEIEYPVSSLIDYKYELVKGEWF